MSPTAPRVLPAQKPQHHIATRPTKVSSSTTFFPRRRRRRRTKTPPIIALRRPKKATPTERGVPARGNFDDEKTTVDGVTKTLREESRSHPTFYPSERIGDRVMYASDVFEFTGSKEEFQMMQERFERRQNTDLMEVESEIENVSSVDRNVFLVRWNVTFVPAKLAWLQKVARNWPFGEVDVERKDILHKMGERTKFTYKALFQTLKRMAVEKKLTMPVAKIEGQTKMTFANEKLTRIEERLSLVQSVNSNRVRNKRICRDLLEFYDTRKPIGMDFKTYDEMVESKVDIYSVPGMRTLDVDGMDDQQGNIEDVTAVLGFMTLFVLSFGVGIGSWYFDALRKDALMQKILDADF